MTTPPEYFDGENYPPIPTPTNDELRAKVEKDPEWLQEWLDEDMEGLF
jgi:hypothetical protein